MNLLSLARWSSAIFSPFLGFAYIAAVFALSQNLDSAGWMGLGVLVITGNLIPAGFVLYLMKKGVVADFHIKKREQRHRFYLFLFLCLIVGGVLIGLFSTAGVFRAWLASFLAVMIVGLVNLKWKISAHLTVMAAIMTFFVMYLYAQMGIVSYWIALGGISLVGWARIYARCHTPLQVVAGAALGTGLVVLVHLF